MRYLLTMLAILVGTTSAFAQVFIGPDLGLFYGRTLDAGLIIYPKNEDWIAATVGGGYTFHGPMLFARHKAECIDDFKNGGWHLRMGLRNGLTVDHHASHFFWAFDIIYSRQHESALLNVCEESIPDSIPVSQSLNVWSGALTAGYTWNPMRGRTIYQKFLVDFGLRVSYPFKTSVPLLGERDYISGVGFTWFPIRSIAFAPVAAVRWELFHGRYGYSKGRTRKLFKN